MGKTLGKAEMSKKAAGNAKKAAVAAEKQAKENEKQEAEIASKWEQGAKGKNAKKEEAEAKKAEAARKKAERDAQLEEETKNARAQPKGAGAKKAEKKGKGLDLSQLDDSATSKKGPALNATGIDNALDALSLTNNTDNSKIDRHPERRFKAAYAAFEERRLPEIEKESPGLRRNQRIEICRKEFEKSEENPFNQVAASYDMSKEEMKELRERERAKLESRLGS